MWQFCLRILAVVAVSVAQMDSMQMAPKRSQAQQYCGKNLANILMLVCNGEYNGLKSKKSEDVNSEEPGYWIQPLSSEEPQFPFRARPKAASLISGPFRRFTRSPRGVYDECCLKGCTYRELQSYCLRREATATVQ